MRADQRDAGADEIGEAEGWRDVVFATQQAVEPVVLLQPQTRLDDILRINSPRGRCDVVLASRHCGGKNPAYLASVAAWCFYERMSEGWAVATVLSPKNECQIRGDFAASVKTTWHG